MMSRLNGSVQNLKSMIQYNKHKKTELLQEGTEKPARR